VPPRKNVNPKEPESEGGAITLEDRRKVEEERRLQTMRELKEKVKTFLLDVELVPKELIFVGRAMRILQANNQAMGKYVVSCFSAVTLIMVDFPPGSPVNRLNILARHASSGLLIDTSRSSSSLPPTTDTTSTTPQPSVKEWIHGYLSSRVSFLRFRTTLFAIDLVFHLTNWTAWLSHTRKRLAERIWGQQTRQSPRSGKFEDALEDRLREMGMCGHYWFDAAGVYLIINLL